MSNSATHELQHTRLSCPSLSPGVCSNSCTLSQWCYLTIYPLLPPSPSAFILSKHQGLLQWVGSFIMSWLFTSCGQSIGASASASILPINIHCWFPLGLTGLISLLSRGLSGVFSSTTVWRHQFFSPQSFLLSSSHIHTWLLEKAELWLYRPLSAK